MNHADEHPLTLQAQVPDTLNKTRLDQAMATLFPDYSRSLHKQWIQAGQVTIDGVTASKPRQTIYAEQHIQVTVSHPPIESAWQPENIPLDIIHEDNALLVINKPAGLVTHPGAGNPNQTLVNAILHHHDAANTLPRAGIVHRLDKDTSGLLVVAKTRESLLTLTTAMQAREIQRTYEAITDGTLIAGNTIDAPIGRHPISRTKMSVVRSGREAITHYRVIKRYLAHTHVSVQLETGRTHQIRVHFKHIHHPLVGDKTYNPRPRIPKAANAHLIDALQQFPRQALHAKALTLSHPTTQASMTWEAPLPDDFLQLLHVLDLYES